MQYPLCFPVVYHGLIAGHTRQTQLEAVNWLLRGEYNDDDYGNGYSGNLQKEEISNYLKGKAVVPLPKVEGIDEDGFVDRLKERLEKLKLDTDIEFVVSAFHTLFLTKRSRLNKSEIEHFDNIIFVDNDPKKYIAEAIALSLRYSAKTDSVMTKEFIEELHNLHLQEGVQNLFKLSINEQIHYKALKGVPEYIEDKTLRKIWEKVIEAEIKHPGCVSAKTYKVLEQLAPSGARAFMLAAPILLNQLDSNAHFLLDTTGFAFNPLTLLTYQFTEIIRLLQEYDLMQTNPRVYDDVCGVIFTNRNNDICVFAYRKEDAPSGEGFAEKIYNLTETGNELYELIEPPVDNDYLFLATYTLTQQFGDSFTFQIHKYPQHKDMPFFRWRDPKEVEKENLLESFNVDEAIKRKEKDVMENTTYLWWGLTPDEADEAFGKALDEAGI